MVRELRGLPRWLNGRESTCQCKRHRRHVFDPWVGKIPWRREWLLTPIFLPGKSHGQRNLVGYGPWGRRESTQLKQLSSSNRSRELRSQWCRQKKKAAAAGSPSCYLTRKEGNKHIRHRIFFKFISLFSLFA